MYVTVFREGWWYGVLELLIAEGGEADLFKNKKNGIFFEEKKINTTISLKD